LPARRVRIGGRCQGQEPQRLALPRVQPQFTVKVGTCFEDSPIGFDKWLPAMWLLSNTKNGTSSCELARGLGVTQKTAWFMLHRVRLAMQSTTFKMSGAVEVDELYVGGKRRASSPTAAIGRKRLGPRANKTVVLGIMERRGRVRAFVIPDVTRGTLHNAIQAHVEPGSNVYTDAWHCYTGLVSYAHHVVNHDVE
jgi:transposase-like protein